MTLCELLLSDWLCSNVTQEDISCNNMFQRCNQMWMVAKIEKNQNQDFANRKRGVDGATEGTFDPGSEAFEGGMPEGRNLFHIRVCFNVGLLIISERTRMRKLWVWIQLWYTVHTSAWFRNCIIIITTSCSVHPWRNTSICHEAPTRIGNRACNVTNTTPSHVHQDHKRLVF